MDIPQHPVFCFRSSDVHAGKSAACFVQLCIKVSNNVHIKIMKHAVFVILHPIGPMLH